MRVLNFIQFVRAPDFVLSRSHIAKKQRQLMRVPKPIFGTLGTAPKIATVSPEACLAHPSLRAKHEHRESPVQALDKKQRDFRPAICGTQEKHGRSPRQAMDG